MIEIDDDVSIPRRELRFTASRSSGPGGQHVNKVNSRVTLEFRPGDSPSLTEQQQRRVGLRLRSRLTLDGRLRMHCQRHRSQAANREELICRFAELMRQALRPPRRRKKTRPSRAARERRLDQKRKLGRKKEQRSRRPAADD